MDPASPTPSCGVTAPSSKAFSTSSSRRSRIPGLRRRSGLLARRDLAASSSDPRRSPFLRGRPARTHRWVATLCRETVQLHPRLRPELLVAAAIVHDVGRTIELSPRPTFAPTDEGRLLGHVQLGVPPDRGARRGAEPPASRSSCTASPCTTTAGPPAPPRRPSSTTRTSSTRAPPPAPYRALNGLALALGASLAWGVADFVGPRQAPIPRALRAMLRAASSRG